MKLFQLFESSDLIALYGWFHEYIEDNNIDLVDEFENGKILIYDNGKIVHSLDLEEARKMRKILSFSEKSYDYARDVIAGEFKLGEPAIAKDAHYSYRYAKNVIKRRFELGEPIITKDATHSYYYAKDVIKKDLSWVNL